MGHRRHGQYPIGLSVGLSSSTPSRGHVTRALNTAAGAADAYFVWLATLAQGVVAPTTTTTTLIPAAVVARVKSTASVAPAIAIRQRDKQ